MSKHTRAKPGKKSPRFHWTRRRVRLGFFGLIVLAAISLAAWVLTPAGKIDPGDSSQVAQGKILYARECAVCHGDQLQGQPDWQNPKPNGAYPAPPHNASGHTWHHANDELFSIVKNGFGQFAPPGYRSEMPNYAGKLTDAEIRAVLSYIESTWPAEIQEARARHIAAGH